MLDYFVGGFGGGQEQTSGKVPHGRIQPQTGTGGGSLLLLLLLLLYGSGSGGRSVTQEGTKSDGLSFIQHLT